ncbi:HD-GYP domain-containing protein [Ectothiorhodospira haloalkaliphila]|uniref:HD-GYP domain-containing protein n=1 Tax=Ectothiorhodospira haloalkaliphila TaxID=421628 RepID=UPI000A05D0BC|nr:HD-GYP domain-containing protein [Ectothiorhodospira haloalkaliphila]MCG5525631.1 HD-GYP domain-containing protein [Ectothiorhodospira haloalkaliphila]
MAVIKQELAATSVRKGMYVCELDRPWQGTPFPLQGFWVETDEQIRYLKENCTIVAVDRDKTPDELLQPTPGTRRRTRSAIDRVRKVECDAPPPEALAEIGAQMDRARSVWRDAQHYITEVLEDARLGRSVNTGQVRRVVSHLAEQVVESPNALLWLTHLRERDRYTSLHSINVCILSLSFGRFLGMGRDELEVLGLGALLHDIGKLRVPLEILNCPRRLTAEEFEQMKAHPVLGYALLKRNKDLPEQALQTALCHHERINGAGYPNGHKGDAIPPHARLVAVVDVYDAISSKRVYHDGMTPQDALNIIFRMRGEELDTELVEAFIRCVGIYPVGSLVELTSGEVGVVVGFNARHRLRPTVMLLLDAEHSPMHTPSLLNLASTAWEAGSSAPAIRSVLEPGSHGIDPHQVVQYVTQEGWQAPAERAVAR